MNADPLHNILSICETVSVEFKRDGNGAEANTFETICAFLNRFGGDVFLGVLDNGAVVGLPPAAAPQIANHIVNIAGDPGVFQPAVYLAPEIIQWEGRTIVHVHVPNSGEVHSYKRVVYDRAGDADVKIKAFLNSPDGGRVFIGIADNGERIGVHDPLRIKSEARRQKVCKLMKAHIHPNEYQIEIGPYDEQEATP